MEPVAEQTGCALPTSPTDIPDLLALTRAALPQPRLTKALWPVGRLDWVRTTFPSARNVHSSLALASCDPSGGTPAPLRGAPPRSPRA